MSNPQNCYRQATWLPGEGKYTCLFFFKNPTGLMTIAVLAVTNHSQYGRLGYKQTRTLSGISIKEMTKMLVD